MSFISLRIPWQWQTELPSKKCIRKLRMFYYCWFCSLTCVLCYEFGLEPRGWEECVHEIEECSFNSIGVIFFYLFYGSQLTFGNGIFRGEIEYFFLYWIDTISQFDNVITFESVVKFEEKRVNGLYWMNKYNFLFFSSTEKYLSWQMSSLKLKQSKDDEKRSFQK